MFKLFSSIAGTISLLLNLFFLVGTRYIVKQVDRSLAELQNLVINYDFKIDKKIPIDLSALTSFKGFNFKQNIPINIPIKIDQALTGNLNLGSHSIPFITNISGFIPVNTTVPVNFGNIPYSIPLKFVFPFHSDIPIDVNVPVDLSKAISELKEIPVNFLIPIQIKVADTAIGPLIGRFRQSISWIP